MCVCVCVCACVCVCVHVCVCVVVVVVVVVVVFSRTVQIQRICITLHTVKQKDKIMIYVLLLCCIVQPTTTQR